MKKRILMVFVTVALFLNLFTCICFATSKGNAITIAPGADLQESLNAGGSRLYRISADETQYYEFKIRNQSIEVNTGIGFADGFLNLFLGKMHVKIYDAYDDDVASLDIKCGYTGTLSVRFTQDKVYYIEVSSTVAGNYHLNVSKLSDLGANSWGDATVTESTGQTVSEIEAAGDKDWFKFTTDEIRSYYYFELENLQADTMYLYLYEYVEAANELRNVAIVGSNNYISASKNKTSSFNLQLKQNTVYYYYLASTSSGTGSYILNVQRSADAAGASRDAQNAYTIDTDIKYTTSFDGSKDTDYYVFTTKDYDAYYHVQYTYLSFNGSAYSEIYDEDGNKVAGSNGYKCNFSYNAKLNKNTTYYVRFYGDGVGNYEFKVNVKPDEYANNMSAATEVALDTEYSTSFNGTKDSDYVKFTTPDFDAYYHVKYSYLSFDGSAYSEIYDENGNKVVGSNAYKYSFSYNAKLSKNTTYYVRFYGDGVGNYKFAINTKADTYPNTRAEATEIELNREYSTSFNGNKDNDYVKFTTLDTNAYYTVEYIEQNFDAQVYSELYDADGNSIKLTNAYSASFSYSENLSPSTTYYVRFYGDGVGNYKFNIKAVADADGDSKQTATVLSSNQKYPSSLEAANDADWFKVELSESANLLVKLENESIYNGISFKVYTDRDSEIMAYTNISNGYSGSKSKQLDAGTYYIKVYGRSAAGYYTLTVSPCGGGHTEVIDYAVEPTCTGTGLSEGKHCSVCNTVIKKQETVSAKGHSYKNGKCTACGEKDANYVPSFTDVKGGAWYKKYVDYCVKNDIFDGTSATTFSPNTNITRAQFVQVLANVTGIDTSNRNVSTAFSDVPQGKWYTAAVKWASENGVVNGMGGGKFAPNANVTREQMCLMLVNYSGYRGVTLNAVEAKENFADDSSISKWAKAAVYTCQQANIVNGKGAGKFDPKGTGTRAEACVMFTTFHKDYLIK